jgi:hypothetical protein
MTQIIEVIKIIKWLEHIIGTEGPHIMLRNTDIMDYLTDKKDSKIIIEKEEKITIQTIKKLMEDINENDDDFPRAPMTTIVYWLEEIIDEQEPIYLDTGIMDHLIDELESGNETDDIIIIKNGTIKNVRKAFEKINDNTVFKEALESGRGYFLDNIKKLDDNKYKLVWGS